MTEQRVGGPPRAARRPVPAPNSAPNAAAHAASYAVAHAGIRPDDDYAWLGDASDPEAQAYLLAEQKYYRSESVHLAPLRRLLTAEMLGRAAGADASLRWQRGNHQYCTTLAEDGEHEVLWRVNPGEGPDQLVLDLAEVTGGSTSPAVGTLEPSPDGAILAYAVDPGGGQNFDLRFRDVETGLDLPERIPGSFGGGAWSADGAFFFHVAADPSGRPCRVLRHRLGTDPRFDDLVYEEGDPAFVIAVSGTRDGGWIVLDLTSPGSSEVRLVSARYPAEVPRVVAQRRPGVEYRVDVLPGGWAGDGPDRLLIVTNDRAPEFRLVEAPLPLPWSGQPGDPATWGGIERALTAPGERLESVDVFAQQLVLRLRRDCEPFLRIVDRVVSGDPRRSVREVHPGVPNGQLRLWQAHDPGATSVVVVEENLVTAPVWVLIDLATGTRRVLKRSQPPGVDPTRYVTERLWIAAPDGARVPVTLARRRTVLPGTSAGCLLVSHGAHEVCTWPSFSLATLSLLDRGAVYAVAHVRGGGELGRQWWERGRRRRKQNAFDDVVTARDGLVAAGWGGPRGIVARGSGAGALLQAVVYSQAPDRWAGVVAEGPQADVLGDLLRPQSSGSAWLPAAELEEWGDPRGDDDDLAALLAWSPYDNPPPPPRPALLMTGAVHDRRAGLQQPLRWVARLRATDSVFALSQVLLRAELGPGGPEGPRGRFARLRYEAEILAWVFERLGLST